MRKALRVLLSLTGFWLVLLCTNVPSYAGKRIALVIGNSAYKNISPLDNPKNDAELMAATLKNVGFDVVLGTDVDRRKMSRAIRNFGKKLKAAGKMLLDCFIMLVMAIRQKV